jgi:hypothetical protein
MSVRESATSFVGRNKFNQCHKVNSIILSGKITVLVMPPESSFWKIANLLQEACPRDSFITAIVQLIPLPRDGAILGITAMSL